MADASNPLSNVSLTKFLGYDSNQIAPELSNSVNQKVRFSPVAFPTDADKKRSLKVLNDIKDDLLDRITDPRDKFKYR